MLSTIGHKKMQNKIPKRYHCIPLEWLTAESVKDAVILLKKSSNFLKLKLTVKPATPHLNICGREMKAHIYTKIFAAKFSLQLYL